MPLTNKTICLFAPGPIGGAEKVVSLGSEAITKKGFNYEVWVIKEQRAPKAADEFSKLFRASKLTEFISKGVFDFKLYLSLKQAYNNQAGSIFHTHGFKALAYASLIAPLDKIVHTHHGVTSHTFKVKIYEFIEFSLMKRISNVIAVSEFMNQQFKNLGIKNTITIENPLSLNPPKKLQKKDAIRLSYIGRLSPEKGILNLLTACKDLKSSVAWELNIYGDGVLRDQVENYIKTENLTNVIYHGFQSDTSAAYSCTDCLVLPSYTEGLPLTLIEAMCCGIPVIANSVGAIPAILNNKENAILLKDNLPESLRKGIEKSLETYSTLSGAAERETEYFIYRFSIESWVLKTISLYQSV